MKSMRRDHRPWPMPPRPWAVRMAWHDLAFLHWPVDQIELAALLPDGLELDAFEGQAWLGVVPFRMTGVAPRGTPSLPGVSSFAEINLRTYVRHGDRPGVWFFSLDVPHRLPVLVARRFFHLPYFRAQMDSAADGEGINYRSERLSFPEMAFRANYGPAGPTEVARAGSLEHWLTERYCLYSSDGGGRLFRGEIHHAPWPLQPGWAEIELNRTTEQIGLQLPSSAPLVHFARRLDVVAWLIEPAS